MSDSNRDAAMPAEQTLHGENVGSESGRGAGEAHGTEVTQERRGEGEEKKDEGAGEKMDEGEGEGEGTVNSTHSPCFFIPHLPHACGLLPFTLMLLHV